MKSRKRILKIVLLSIFLYSLVIFVFLAILASLLYLQGPITKQRLKWQLRNSQGATITKYSADDTWAFVEVELKGSKRLQFVMEYDQPNEPILRGIENYHLSYRPNNDVQKNIYLSYSSPDPFNLIQSKLFTDLHLKDTRDVVDRYEQILSKVKTWPEYTADEDKYVLDGQQIDLATSPFSFEHCTKVGCKRIYVFIEKVD